MFLYNLRLTRRSAMKCESEVKEILISNAISLIAEGGFEKATTKNLTNYSTAPEGVKMNEAYIYRLFGSKENLYAAAFRRLDSEVYDAFKYAIDTVGDFSIETTKKFDEFFLLAWQFILRNGERCRCYVRYFYSIYFKDESLTEHNRLFEGLIKKISPIFKEEADVKAILHSVFTTLLNFAIRVYNGELENSEINRPHIFNVLYCMMVTYFKDGIRSFNFI